MSLIEASKNSVIISCARLSFSFFVIKLIALYSGPEGVAKLGQFLNFISLIAIFSGGGVSIGIIKCVSENTDNPVSLNKILSTAFFITILATIITTFITFFFSLSLSQYLFQDTDFKNLILVLAISQIFIALNNFTIAIINGFIDTRSLVKIHLSASLVSFFVVWTLAHFLGLYGALLALIISQLIYFFISSFLFLQSPYFKWDFFIPAYNKKYFLVLLKFSSMTLIAAFISPILQIFVRNYLAAEFGWQEVGYWQSVSKVSEAYLMIVTTLFTTYYLPKISYVKDKKKLFNTVVETFSFVMPIVMFSSLCIYIFRYSIILLLFDESFNDSSILYGPQLLGDVIKISSFFLSFIMLAKSMIRIFILSEVFFTLTYFVLIIFLTKEFGLIGSMYAFTLNYLFYLFFNIFIFKNYFKGIYRNVI